MVGIIGIFERSATSTDLSNHADKLVFLISLELYLKGILKFIGESLYDETIGDRGKCK